MSNHAILARVTQNGCDGLSKRIFWLTQSGQTDLMNGDRGLNIFSLYQLSVLRKQLDSGLSLDASQFRDQCTHVANITGLDHQITHEALLAATRSLSRMFSDTLSLSIRAGSSEPCLLPITANITDFAWDESNSSLSSFQSSLVDSFQSSLISAPTDMTATPPGPLSPDVSSIIPQPLRPKSSTPAANTSRPANLHLSSAPSSQAERLISLAKTRTPARRVPPPPVRETDSSSDESFVLRDGLGRRHHYHRKGDVVISPAPGQQAVSPASPRPDRANNPVAGAGFVPDSIFNGGTVTMESLTPTAGIMRAGLDDILSLDTVLIERPAVTQNDLDFAAAALAQPAQSTSLERMDTRDSSEDNAEKYTTYEEFERKYAYMMNLEYCDIISSDEDLY